MRLNERRILAWANVLDEKDAFIQITGQLRNRTTGRCCLGVACDIYSTKRGGFWKSINYNLYFIADYKQDNAVQDENYMPKTVASWYGLNAQNQRCLSMLNDYGCPFRLIAQYLRLQVQRQREGKPVRWNADSHAGRLRTGYGNLILV